MFEVNFRDERYLPFEGNGAISSWQINLPQECNAFDFETISDVIIRLNYTAREGGSQLNQAAWQTRNTALANAQQMQSRLFSAKHEFNNEWYRFLHPADTATSQVLPLALTIERFPFLFRGGQLTIHAMQMFLKVNDAFINNYYGKGQPLAFSLAQAGGTAPFAATFKLEGSPIAGIAYAEPLNGQTGSIGSWSITAQSTDSAKLDAALQQVVTANGQTYTHLNADAIEDIWIVCQYSVK